MENVSDEEEPEAMPIPLLRAISDDLPFDERPSPLTLLERIREGLQQIRHQAISDMEEDKEEEIVGPQFTCEICYCSYSESQAAKILCYHKYCVGCIKMHCTTKIKDGKVEDIGCPNWNCF